MDIFVRSRGVESQKDYTWLKITPTTQEKIEHFPDLFQYESTHLIYAEKPSVVLSRRSGQLLLLITAIAPKARGDSYKRQIRVSVGWIGESCPENQIAFRLLAARALDEQEVDTLTQEIAEAVPLGGVDGFEPNFHKLLSLITSGQNENQNLTLSEEEENFNKLAQLSPQIKQSLVKMLTKFDLPKREGVLVVCTTNKTESTLKQSKVWRGVSSLVKSSYWKVYYPFPEPIPEKIAQGLNFQITIFKLLRSINHSWGDWLIDSMENQINQQLLKGDRQSQSHDGQLI